MPSNTNKYGSIPEKYNNENEIEEELGIYPIENTLFIVSTAEEKRKKCMNAFTPVLIFVVLMGSIAFALSRDFNHLYPGHGGWETTSTTNNGSKNSLDVEASDSEQDMGNKVSSNNHVEDVQNVYSAYCSRNHNCVLANVSGVCCPTSEGVQLECCN
eukprot:scaffold787_cov285-Chaetoceros_neogracile.AAC.72